MRWIEFGSKSIASTEALFNQFYGVALISALALALLAVLGVGRFRLHLPRGMKLQHRFRLRLIPTSLASRMEVVPNAGLLLPCCYLMAFGFFGLVLGELLGQPVWVSSVGAAILSAFVVAVLFAFLCRFFGNTGSEVKGGALVGTVCQVSLEIPSGGVGVIAYISDGKRHTYPARSNADRTLPKGSRVFVADLSKGVAVVDEFDLLPSVPEKV